jgi:hypothetical protein
MNILLSLSPFIAFFVLMRVVHPLGLSALSPCPCFWASSNGAAANP